MHVVDTCLINTCLCSQLERFKGCLVNEQGHEGVIKSNLEKQRESSRSN